MKQIQKNTTQHTVMMGMFCEEHFNNLTKTKELLNFPIC